MNTISKIKRFIIFGLIAFVLVNISILNYANANNWVIDDDAEPVSCITEGDGSVLNYGTHEYWLAKCPEMSYISSLSYGQKLDSGVYCLTESFTLVPGENEFANDTDPKSALKINGDVTLIFENNCTLTVKGKDSNSIYGAGAGIEINEDSTLKVKGCGNIVADGGAGAYGASGEKGEDAIDDPCLESGDGGAGGNGGGGAGAAIGTCGGQGGTGGAAVDGRHQGTSYKSYHGRNGHIGGNGLNSIKSGKFKAYGNITVDVQGGNTSKMDPKWLKGGQSTYGGDTILWPVPPIPCASQNSGGGGSGGCGGSGFPGASIGSGGSGGGGAGSGGSGGITRWIALGQRYNNYPAGGGGGSGFGYLEKDDPQVPTGGVYLWEQDDKEKACYMLTEGRVVGRASNGCGGNEFWSTAGGNGGNGGSSEWAAKAGNVYSTNKIEGIKDNDNRYWGQNSTQRNVYPADECVIRNFSMIDKVTNYEVVHVPTNTILKRDVDYFEPCAVWGDDNNIEVTIVGIPGESNNMLTDATLENPGILTWKTKQLADVVIHHNQQKLNNDKTEVTDKYEAIDTNKGVAEIGIVTNFKPQKFEGLHNCPVEQITVKEGKNTVEIYYDRNEYNLTFNGGDLCAWKEHQYTKIVPYGALISKLVPIDYQKAQENYIFNSWSPDLDEETTVPDKDSTYTAVWSPECKRSVYRVEELFQKIEKPKEYTLGRTNTLPGLSGNLTNYKAKEYEHFHSLPFNQEIISNNGETLLKVYYDRDIYNLTVNIDSHAHYSLGDKYCKEFAYNTDVTCELKSILNFVSYDEGYSFGGYGIDLDKPLYITSNLTLNLMCESDWCDIEIVRQPRIGEVVCNSQRVRIGDKVSCEYQTTLPYAELKLSIKDELGSKIEPQWTYPDNRNFEFTSATNHVYISCHSVDTRYNINITQPKSGTINCTKDKSMAGSLVLFSFIGDSPYDNLFPTVRDSEGNDIEFYVHNENSYEFICPRSDVYISGEVITSSKVTIIKPDNVDFVLDVDRPVPGTEVKCTCSYSSSTLMCSNLDITDAQGNKIDYKGNGKDQYSFVCPYSDVTIIVTPHTVKEFHKQISQTFHDSGLRAYYVTDDGLYFRANDAYSDATNKDNSVGTLIGNIDDFNLWKEVYCSDHTTSAGIHYAKGWGGKIEPDM